MADGMLGKLTRWLRMLGYDTEYARSTDDGKLIELAKRDARTILTRDIKLYQQATIQGVDAFLVEAISGPEKLAEVAKRFQLNLKVNPDISRCPRCNTNLKVVPKDSILGKIHKTTSTHYQMFWECPKCSHVYWRGAHWKRIDRTLKDARRALQS